MKVLRSSAFVFDQAASSIVTFLLFTAIAKNGGAQLVGSVAVLQSIVLVALTVARALSLDVWASRGALADERRLATATALVLPLVVIIVIGPTIWTLNATGLTLILYWVAAPAVLVLDVVRILLLHADKSWLSLICQLFTVGGLAIAALVAHDPSISMAIYAGGTITTCIVGFIGLRVWPPIPSIKYALVHRNRSLPFLAEVSLGSIVQQILFLLLAALSSITIAGQIRIAQTLIGPMAVIHAGLAPQILRRLGRLRTSGKDYVVQQGVKYGWILAGCSFAGVVTLVLALNIKISNQSLLAHFVGKNNDHLTPIIVACGLALAFNGSILGTGTAARVNGTTSRLNKARIFIVPIQIIIVCLAALSNIPIVAAVGFALTAAATASISIWVVKTDLRPQRGRRRVVKNTK